MSGLVGYGSSDEEDEISTERPAKVAKLDPHRTDLAAFKPNATSSTPAPPTSTAREEAQQPEDQVHANVRTSLPAPGPSIPTSTNPPTPASAPLSPYSTERQRIHDLTLPRNPNFSIPSSPPPPSSTEDPDAAASLAATTKRFERFLALKAQGVHFNDRLRGSAALRNPSLLPKLMEFAGITREESYASALPRELAVPGVWVEECYVENLVKVNDRREKKRLGEREGVDFVPARTKSAVSSAAGTPKGGTGTAKGGGEGRKSRFDVDK